MSQDFAPDPLLTQRHVAETCGCAETTVEKWRQLDRGPRYIKVGHLVRYRRQDVEDWLKSRTVEPSMPPAA